MKKRNFKIGDILFVVFIALLLVPQTRTPIQVALNKLKVLVWSPRAEAVEDREKVEAFTYSVHDLNGVSKNIGIAQGKVTFLSYWATWCPPCIAELPGIQALYTDYKDRINFILLTQEEVTRVQRFMEKKGYDLPVYFPLMPPPDVLQENSIPTNYIIDAQGTIVIKETGAADWNSTATRAVLDGLLSE